MEQAAKGRRFPPRLKDVSIKWKIFLYLIGFCALLLVLLWLFQVVFLDSFYKFIKVSEVKKSAASIIRNLDNDDLETLAEQIAYNNDVYIYISWGDGQREFTSEMPRFTHALSTEATEELFRRAQEQGGELLQYGNILGWKSGGRAQSSAASIPNAPEEVPSPASQPQEPASFDGNKFSGKLPFQWESPMESLVYARTVTDSSGTPVRILINSVISPVYATVTTLRVQLFYITGAMLIFSVLLALLIAKKVSTPIEEVSRSAKVLATGRYDITFQGTGYREINQLSETLNYAAGELNKVEDLRQELIANVSHDLRTPLTLISGYAEAMRDLPEENNAENAQIIVDESQRLTTLVNDLLDLSKIQSGMQQLSLFPFCLTESIRQCVERTSRMIQSQGYEITFTADREVTLTADENKVVQAFYNLLSNAVNHAGPQKRILVRQEVEEGFVKLSVEDHGEGIDPQDLPYIWDRYYKVDKTHKRSVAGTGLGLSIVKSIVQLHGGEYGVISQPGAGSTFWFRLKLDPPEA